MARWLKDSSGRQVDLATASVLNPTTGRGLPLKARIRARLTEAVGFAPLHGEITGDGVELMVDRPAPLRDMTLCTEGYRVRLHDVRP